MRNSVRPKQKSHFPRADALRYSPKHASRSTVRRQYIVWRRNAGIPPRCDIPTCQFHAQPLTWRGKELPVILDHINGNNRDNNPANLRYLCPNCDSQLETRGGKNRGRVQEAVDGRYVLLTPDGRRHMHIIPERAALQVIGHAPTVTQGPHRNDA